MQFLKEPISPCLLQKDATPRPDRQGKEVIWCPKDAINPHGAIDLNSQAGSDGFPKLCEENHRTPQHPFQTCRTPNMQNSKHPFHSKHAVFRRGRGDCIANTPLPHHVQFTFSVLFLSRLKQAGWLEHLWLDKHSAVRTRIEFP